MRPKTIHLIGAARPNFVTVAPLGPNTARRGSPRLLQPGERASAVREALRDARLTGGRDGHPSGRAVAIGLPQIPGRPRGS